MTRTRTNELRRAVKSLAAGAFTYSGLRRGIAAWRRAQAGGRRILIVGYHRVVGDYATESQRCIPGTLISQRTFRNHLEEAHAAGFQFATVGEALDVIAGKREARRDLFVITFDDGYRDVYDYALPILREMGVPSMLYLPADMIGTDRRFDHDRLYHLVQLAHQRRLHPRDGALPEAAMSLLQPVLSGSQRASQVLDTFIGEHSRAVLAEVIGALEKELGPGPELVPPSGQIMTWEEVRRTADAGVELGAHTLGHTVLTLEDRASVVREVRGSKARIEEETGRPVLDFAYCNGWYSDEVIRALAEAGFRSGVTTEDYPNRIGGDPFTLKRKVLWENFSLGMDGEYSSCLTRCHFDDVFAAFGQNQPVSGRRIQNVSTHVAATEGLSR